MTKEPVYLLFLHPGDNPEEDGALIKEQGSEYFRCSKRYPWKEDRDAAKYFYYDPDDTEEISNEGAEALLKKWEPGWKKAAKAPPEKPAPQI